MPYTRIVYSPEYPWQARDGTPAVAIHWCDCAHWCGSNDCMWRAETAPEGGIKITSQGTRP